MMPENATKELENRIRQSGTAMPELTLAQGIRLMIEFYKNVRADGCEFDEDGDMLLFQWGTFDWGEGPSFECDITRQFYLSQADVEGDDAISQLRFTFRFPTSDHFDAINSSNQWCRTPAELDDFEEFITESEAYRAVRDLPPTTVTLDYGRV